MSRVRKTHEQFLEDLEINGKGYLEILTKYEKNYKYVTYKCKMCGYVGENTAYNLLHGQGCKVCSLIGKYNKELWEEFCYWKINVKEKEYE